MIKKIITTIVLVSSFNIFAGISIKKNVKTKLGVVEFINKKTKTVTIYSNDKKKYKIKMSNVFSDLANESDKSLVKVGKAVLFLAPVKKKTR